MDQGYRGNKSLICTFGTEAIWMLPCAWCLRLDAVHNYSPTYKLWLLTMCMQLSIYAYTLPRLFYNLYDGSIYLQKFLKYKV